MITSGIGTLRLLALDLGGPKSKPPPRTSTSWRVTPYRAPGQVDIAPSQAAQLTPAQAAEHPQQHQRPVSLVGRIGERIDLGDGQGRPLG